MKLTFEDSIPDELLSDMTILGRNTNRTLVRAFNTVPSRDQHFFELIPAQVILVAHDYEPLAGMMIQLIESLRPWSGRIDKLESEMYRDIRLRSTTIHIEVTVTSAERYMTENENTGECQAHTRSTRLTPVGDSMASTVIKPTEKRRLTFRRKLVD